MAEGSRKRERRPRPLAEVVGRFRRDAGPPTLLAGVQESWARAVGASVAEQAVPVGERGGVVTVRCRAAVWAAELTMLSAELLGKVNGELPEGRRVKGLKFVVEGR